MSPWSERRENGGAGATHLLQHHSRHHVVLLLRSHDALLRELHGGLRLLPLHLLPRDARHPHHLRTLRLQVCQRGAVLLVLLVALCKRVLHSANHSEVVAQGLVKEQPLALCLEQQQTVGRGTVTAQHTAPKTR